MPLYPKPSLPEWADPAQASVMDPLYKTLARRATSTLGLDDPSSQIMGAATPMTAVETMGIGPVKGILKEELGSKAEAAAALIKHLLGFNAAPVDKSLVPADKLMSKVPPPLRYSDMLKRTFSRVPEAQGAFDIPGSVIKRAPGLPTQYEAQAAFRSAGKVPQEQSLLKDTLMGRYDRTAVKSLDDLKDVVPSALNTTATERPAIIGRPWNGASNGKAMAALKRSNITQDDIRLIRQISREQAIEKYPQLSPEALYGIKRKDTFNWVKD